MNDEVQDLDDAALPSTPHVSIHEEDELASTVPLRTCSTSEFGNEIPHELPRFGVSMSQVFNAVGVSAREEDVCVCLREVSVELPPEVAATVSRGEDVDLRVFLVSVRRKWRVSQVWKITGTASSTQQSTNCATIHEIELGVRSEVVDKYRLGWQVVARLNVANLTPPLEISIVFQDPTCNHATSANVNFRCGGTRGYVENDGGNCTRSAGDAPSPDQNVTDPVSGGDFSSSIFCFVRDSQVSNVDESLRMSADNGVTSSGGVRLCENAATSNSSLENFDLQRDGELSVVGVNAVPLVTLLESHANENGMIIGPCSVESSSPMPSLIGTSVLGTCDISQRIFITVRKFPHGTVCLVFIIRIVVSVIDIVPSVRICRASRSRRSLRTRKCRPIPRGYCTRAVGRHVRVHKLRRDLLATLQCRCEDPPDDDAQSCRIGV